MALTPKELASYTFCNLQWKLQSQRDGPHAARKRGIESHADLRRRIVAVREQGRKTFLHFLYVLASGMLALMASTLADLFPLAQNQFLMAFYVLALVTAALGYQTYRAHGAWQAAQANLKVDVFSIESLDLPWASEEHGLVGKPDCVTKHDDVLIPIEFKSGDVPPTAWDNDVAQIGAYALLMESAYGRRPPRGIIQYANGQHPVIFTDSLMAERVLEPLRQLRSAAAGAEVGRSHNNRNKCASCFEREGCPAALR